MSSKILQTIFSIKNSKDKTHKLVRILGIKIKIKRHLPIKNLYVGCGEDFIDGYTGCDIRKTKTAKVICKAWDISKKLKNLENIYSRHMCEHLTFQEFEMALKDWMKALAPLGTIHIIVPNIDYHIEQFKRAKFDEASLNANKWSDLSWALAGFYGWQRENYSKDSNKTKYWDVHKSGYNAKLMKLFLERAGYIHISCEIIDNVHLSVKARKPMNHDFSLTSGERQTGKIFSEIRQDHLNRYNLAIDMIKKYCNPNIILNGMDVFCGNGYGSKLIEEKTGAILDSFDGSEEAVKFAQKYYSDKNIKFENKLFPFDMKKNKYDFVVSLESIEHVKDDKLFLKRLYESLKTNGILIVSTPNMEKQDLTKNINHFHYRHYYNNEFIDISKEIGFEPVEIYGQDTYIFNDNGIMCGMLQPQDMILKKDYNGQFTVFGLKKN